MTKTVYLIRSNTRPTLRSPAFAVNNQNAISEPTMNVRSRMIKPKDVGSLISESSISKPPRRRERLTHLSQEEKLNRRKMKNREAAQNARDRKKEQSRHLEDTVRELVMQNKQLRAENARLRADVNRLSNGGAAYQQQSSVPSQTNVYTTDYSPQSTVFSDCDLSAPRCRVCRTPLFPAVDSGYDKLHVESPSIVGECIELYSPVESTQTEGVVYGDEFDYNCAIQMPTETQWTPNNVVPPPTFDSQLTAINEPYIAQGFMDEQAMHDYEELVQSPFVDELCGELDRWNEEIETESKQATQSLPSTNVDYPTDEFNGLEDLDLFEFCDF
ncbi:BZIP domain-containing protein [Aphelenchoides besseyi]|nr:BZIP domain-containing protein [Aphelenchoides besseyi]